MDRNDARPRRSANALYNLVENGEILSLDAANERHDGEWLLFLVTGENENHAISHGRVLTHHKSRGQITRDYLHVRARYPDACLYRFFAARRITTGEEARKFLAELNFGEKRIHAWW
jgi:hypothetical protein